MDRDEDYAPCETGRVNHSYVEVEVETEDEAEAEGLEIGQTHFVCQGCGERMPSWMA
jgi:hypothetical protein